MPASVPLAAEIAADPSWLPHRIDWAGKRMQFLKLARSSLGEAGFLADRKPAGPDGEAWLPLDAVMAMQVDSGPIHFLFHTAFCRSTLLARALDRPGEVAALNEPHIFAALAGAGVAPGQPGAPLLAPVLKLLARSFPDEASVVVKPTNHANALIPAILAALPDARAILMTNPLPSFLAAVIRKGMMGRRWGRTLYLEMQSYAGLDLGMDAREQFAMTDLQAAALAWLLAQRWFAMQQDRFGERLAVLDGDRFAREKARALMQVAAHLRLEMDQTTAQEIAEGPVFASHAKSGEDFAAKDAADAARSRSAVTEEEIAQVGQWIGLIASQLGLETPRPQTLF